MFRKCSFHKLSPLIRTFFNVSFCLYFLLSVFACFLFVCVASLDKMVSWFPLGKRDMFDLGTFLSLQMRWWRRLFLIFWLWPMFPLLEIKVFFVSTCFDPFSVGMVCWKRSSVCCWDLWETPQECHQQWQQTGKEKFWDFQTIFFASHGFVQLIRDFAHNQTQSHRCLQKYWFSMVLCWKRSKFLSRTNQWNQWMEGIDDILNFLHIVQSWCNVVLSSFNLIWFKYCYISLPSRSVERNDNLRGCQRENNVLILVLFLLRFW